MGRLTGVALALLTVLLAGAPAQARSVDVELVLLVDVSFSIGDDDHLLQKEGYVRAFRDPELHAAIAAGMLGRIAVTYVEWDHSQRQLVDWTLIEDAADAERFADAIAAAPRHRGGAYTGLTGALGFAKPLFADNGFEGLRRVIDVSGDGVDNTGRDILAARDALLADGETTVNGIVIGEDDRTRGFYKDNVIGGPRAFLFIAREFGLFGKSIREKLVLEIANRGLGYLTAEYKAESR